jgi:hypothetical protein
MGKNFLIKTSMGKPPNEMGNCPFASPWLRHCTQRDQEARVREKGKKKDKKKRMVK